MFTSTSSFIFGLVLSSTVYAAPAISKQLNTRTDYPGYAHPTNGNCQDYTLNYTVTTSNYVWGDPKLQNDFDTADLLFNITSQDDALDLTGSFSPFNGTQNVTAEYSISGTFCSPKTPKGNGTEQTVLVATHGFGFDRRYWAPEDEEYSLAKYVLDAGYSFFYYDRLGVGRSQRISGFENQISLQNALLANIVEDLRNGSYTGDVTAKKIVLVGHSFGSFYSHTLIAEHPDLVDAAVLIGMAYASSTSPANTLRLTSLSNFASRIANQRPASSAPQFASTFDNGWLSFGDIYNYAETFLHQPDYDVAAAKASFAITQPFSVSDYASTYLANLDVSKFTGKVWLGSGEFDLVVCGGDCNKTYKDGTQDQIWSGVDGGVKTFLLDGAGHGPNFARNHELLFADIVGFLGGV